MSEVLFPPVVATSVPWRFRDSGCKVGGRCCSGIFPPGRHTVGCTGVRVGGESRFWPAASLLAGVAVVVVVEGAGGWKMGARWSEGMERSDEEVENDADEIEEEDEQDSEELTERLAPRSESLWEEWCSRDTEEVWWPTTRRSFIFPRRPSSFSGCRFTRGGGLPWGALSGEEWW